MRKKYGIIKKAESKGDCLDFMAEQILHMQDPAQWQALCGNFDENIRTLEQLYEVTIVCRDTEIKVNGAEAKAAQAANAGNWSAHLPANRPLCGNDGQ